MLIPIFNNKDDFNSGTIKIALETVNIYKLFRVSVLDTYHDILPSVLKKFLIFEDPANYSFFVNHENQGKLNTNPFSSVYDRKKSTIH